MSSLYFSLSPISLQLRPLQSSQLTQITGSSVHKNSNIFILVLKPISMTLLGWGGGTRDHSSWLSSTIPFARLRNERLAADEVKKGKSSSVSFFSFCPPQVFLSFFSATPLAPLPAGSLEMKGERSRKVGASRETHTSQYSEY